MMCAICFTYSHSPEGNFMGGKWKLIIVINLTHWPLGDVPVILKL